MDKTKHFETIDEYISQFPENIRKLLIKIRETIKEMAPDAEEAIKYEIPTFTLNGNLVHFAAYKNHIGFYPAPEAIEVFKNDLIGYKTSKGAIQFPIGQPIPFGLIKRIVSFRVEQNRRIVERK